MNEKQKLIITRLFQIVFAVCLFSWRYQFCYQIKFSFLQFDHYEIKFISIALLLLLLLSFCTSITIIVINLNRHLLSPSHHPAGDSRQRTRSTEGIQRGHPDRREEGLPNQTDACWAGESREDQSEEGTHRATVRQQPCLGCTHSHMDWGLML